MTTVQDPTPNGSSAASIATSAWPEEVFDVKSTGSTVRCRTISARRCDHPDTGSSGQWECLLLNMFDDDRL
jgi:hypothetical protein